jgi:Na+/proline symporter
VSKWTWAATLLQSANVAYKYGVSGPFWYAAGATIQVLLFAVLAVEIKRKVGKRAGLSRGWDQRAVT